MTANPIELIGGLATTANVTKADIVAWAKARVPQVFGDLTEIRNTVLAGQLVVSAKSNGVTYAVDTADTTSTDDGLTCIVSLDGKRFKPVSSVPVPTTVSLGGVFASAAVANQFLTGLDTAGNLLRRQPAAADLSDGNSGTGTVVHATGATQTGGTHTALTGLGIRSTGAAFDLKIANTEVLTADRTLTVKLNDAARTFDVAGNVTLAGALTTAGAFGLTLTTTGSTNVTLPTTGTLATIAGVETPINKVFNAANNTVSNLTTAMFAANVVDTDGTFAANSNTRLASQAAVKTYVDTVAQGLDAKQSVLNATTTNITLSGEQTIDGQLTSASRILVKNQTTTSQNGIYITGSGAWTRALDFDAWTELPGAFVFVEKGTTFGDTGWVCTVDAGGTIGSTAVTFTQFSGAGTYTASTGLTLTGTAFSIDSTVATLTGAQALTNKSYNGNTWTAGTGTLTIAAGKTFTASNTYTSTATDGSTVAFGAGGTVAYQGGTLAQFAATTSAQLAGVISDETGSGALVFATGAVMTGGTHTGLTGLALRDTTAAFDVTLAAVSTSAALTAGRTLTVDMGNVAHTIQFGTTANTITFPNAASDTVLLAAAAQTVTGKTFDTAAASNTFKLNGVTVATATQFTAALNAMVGDSGSGGTKGLVPAPASGDAAAGKYLKADGTYAVPPGGSGLSAAVQSDMETATSNAVAVTPGTAKFAPTAAKVWLYVTYSGGTPTNQISFGVSSITDAGVGNLTVAFSTSFSSANYCGLVTQESATNTNVNEQISSLAAGSCSVFLLSSGALSDPSRASVAFFGDV